MRKRILIATMCLLAVFTGNASSSSEQTRALRYYKDILENVINNSRRMMKDGMSRPEIRIERSIRFKVSPTGDVTALAKVSSDGRREVIVSSGMGQILEWLATAYVLDTEFGITGCAEEYSSYLMNQIVKNSNRVADGHRPKAAYDVFVFSRRYGDACNNLNRNMLSGGDSGELFAAIMDASIVFLYLHETAHHVLHHVDKGEREPQISRSQEAAADAWAVNTAFKADFNLSVAVPTFMLLAGLGGDSLEAERKSTHPLGIRRVHTMLVDVRNLMEEQDSDYIDEMDELIDEIKTQLMAIDT